MGNSAERDTEASSPAADLDTQKPESNFSLEDELESLPAHEGGKSASSNELSIENELALLSKSSSEGKNKRGLLYN